MENPETATAPELAKVIKKEDTNPLKIKINVNVS